MVMQRKFIIIGTDDNRTPFFPPEVLEHIRHGKVFSGGSATQRDCRKLVAG